MSFEFGILGAGGQADETQSYAAEGSRCVFRAVDKKYLNGAANLIDILDPTEEQKGVTVVAAVGAPSLRKSLVEKWPGGEFTTIRSRYTYIDNSAVIGLGSIIAPGVVITTNVRIGDHVQVNLNATISHDTTIGNYVTIAPGAHVAGHVTLGDGVYVGIGATVSNGIKIAPGVVIGAGAVVIRDIDEENSVVVGVPGKVIKQNPGWLNEI